MTTLYLVRHGETVDNAAQILQGHLQGELNERGIQQAETTRDKLKDEPIHVGLLLRHIIKKSKQLLCFESVIGEISRGCLFLI
mgnify:CR=1 FL=1